MIFGIIYTVLFFITAFALFFIAIRSLKNIDTFYWSLEFLFPIVNLGYCLRAFSTSLGAAIIANDFICIEGTIIPLIYLFSMCRSFKIPITKGHRTFGYILASFLYMFIILGTGGGAGLYYKTLELVQAPQGSYLVRTYGLGCYLQIVYGAMISLSMIAVLIYIFRHQERCSIVLILAYAGIGCGAIIIFAIQLIFKLKYELFPFVFAFASWAIALSYELSFRHDIDSIIMNVNNENNNRGYVAFDMQKRFLGANEKARSFLPFLNDLHLDRPIGQKNEVQQRIIFNQMINSLEEGGSKVRFEEGRDKKIIKYEISYFYSRKNAATLGYLFELTDDTEHQRNLEIIRHYNIMLELDVNQQTEHIREIQNKVVLGLADMIENRDDSTGGHVKRTSDIIKIIVDEMINSNIGDLDRTMAEHLVRAAPMHDLGKIAVDNSILCKPGELTPKEWEIMKTHPVKSGDIVNAILKDVEEPGFVQVAYNVARFHHEWWNGSGYPEGRKGTDIPLEARIMAVADVYDALVSKRQYKEAMSFEAAYTEMKKNMGIHFDPMMDEVFELCHPALEEYYRGLEAPSK